MPKLPIVEPKDLLRYLISYGCKVVRVRGSHHRILNPLNGQFSTLPMHHGNDIGVGLFAKILKDLGIDAKEFVKFIQNQ